MTNETVYTITQNYQESDAKFISSQIDQFNLVKAPSAQVPSTETINLMVKDLEGRIVGGLLGSMNRFALYVSFLWVSEELRGQGYGSKLLEEVEGIVRAKGGKMIHLDTWSFQAPEFYKKQGFEIFGVLEGFPEGFKRYFLKKDLG
ncbi:GNAT family N-acetyltransferase [Paenibacillus sp. CC-CFT747]|nr:GNAT family N-acetyltransferase [Paenibacillus sp. CC-CFT747]